MMDQSQPAHLTARNLLTWLPASLPAATSLLPAPQAWVPRIAWTPERGYHDGSLANITGNSSS
ncbi:Uncharacterised protein [Mycobacteroides abscessus subsp. massiliense]|nr:Uncharacterised protein [Mycobacteroides abscessus subsp. massiliense]